MDEFKIKLEHFLKIESFEFQPTQEKLSVPLICRIYKKMNAGLCNFDAIKIADDLIIDGHHRYIASKMAGTQIQIFPSTKNYSQRIFDWKGILLNLNEYDSATEIKYHNFNDATKNGISVDLIEKILNN